MKQMYIVCSDDYAPRPLMAYENRNDAVKAACVIHDCPADKIGSKEIRAVPFMLDQPQHADISDVQTVIDMTLQAVQSASQIIGQSVIPGKEQLWKSGLMKMETRPWCGWLTWRARYSKTGRLTQAEHAFSSMMKAGRRGAAPESTYL